MRIIILIFFVSIKLVHSQSLEGNITDGSLNIPYSSIILGKEFSTVSDENGFFFFSNVPLGEYELVISTIGYKKLKQKVIINSQKNSIYPILKKRSYDLSQVVVTGTMKETFIHASPVKVEVLSQNFIQKIATSNLMEVIENVNGVQKQINCGVCGTNDIHINGMEGPYTLVLIDGMPIMSSLSTVYGLNGIPSSLIKQIEIIKGPSSTLYGTEAVAGVINVITKKPQDVSLFELDGYINSHEERKIDFLYAPKIKTVDFLLSGNLYKMNNFLDDNSDGFLDIPFSNRFSLFNMLSIDRKSDKTFQLSGKYYKENRSGGVEEWTDEYRGSDSIYGESIYTDRIELGLSYQFPIQENIRLDASYNSHHQDSYYGKTQYEAWQEVYFANFLWDKKIGLNHDFLIGYTHRYQTYIDSTLAMSNDHKFIPGFFIQDELKIRHNLSFLVGLRVDHHKNHDFIYSPRLNIKWNPDSYTSIRLNTGTGFRTVNLFTEDHAALTGSREVLVVNHLNPEESFNINLNINQFFNTSHSSGTIDLDCFYTYFKNKIIPDYETDQSKIIYDNLEGFSISRGIAINFKYNFKIPVNINFGGTYLDVYSKDLEGNKEEEIFAPKFSGVFSVSWLLQKYNLNIDWTGKMTGPMNLPTYSSPFSRDERSPWFTLQNVQIKKDLNESLSVYIGVKNIFNYTQESPIVDADNPFSDDFDTTYSYGPLQTRRFIFGIRYKLL